jgi:hypothetical protein
MSDTAWGLARRMEGIHLGTFAGIPASRNPVKPTAIVIYQIREGEVARLMVAAGQPWPAAIDRAIPLLAVAAPRA